MTDDETAIRSMVETWMRATRAGDVATLLDLLTDDVIFLVPGRPPFGKAAFRAAWEGMKGIRVEGEARIEEIQVLGNWAWLRNRIEIVITPPGGTPAPRSGHTLTLLRKDADSQWRIMRDANLVT